MKCFVSRKALKLGFSYYFKNQNSFAPCAEFKDENFHHKAKVLTQWRKIYCSKAREEGTPVKKFMFYHEPFYNENTTGSQTKEREQDLRIASLCFYLFDLCRHTTQI